MKIKDLKEGYLYKDYSKRGHCKNGTFIFKLSEGKPMIADTYWYTPEFFTPTEDFISQFEEVLKLSDYRILNISETSLYDDEDVIQVHYTQCSGRFADKRDCFIKKDAKKSVSKIREKLVSDIEYFENKLKNMKSELIKIDNGEENISYW